MNCGKSVADASCVPSSTTGMHSLAFLGCLLFHLHLVEFLLHRHCDHFKIFPLVLDHFVHLGNIVRQQFRSPTTKVSGLPDRHFNKVAGTNIDCHSVCLCQLPVNVQGGCEW